MRASLAVITFVTCVFISGCENDDATSRLAAADARRSVLLVTIDTLRADRLGCTGWARARTPHLDALADAGTLYPNAIAPAPLTLPSHSTLFSGLLPHQHGARDNKPFRFPADRFDTITTTLRSRGYRTLAVIGGDPLARGCGLERDFDRYDDAFPRTSTGSVRLGERPANLVTDAALAAIDSVGRDDPFFLFVHYFDPHDPYLPPQDLLAAFADAPYDGEIAFVDREFGRLLAGLKSRGLEDDLVIVVTSDHGESLGEHGEASHGYFVYDATIRVPLIARVPGGPRGRIDEQVRLQDVRAFLDAAAAGRDADLAGPARRGDPALIESLYGQLHCDFAQLRGLRSPRGFKYLDGGDAEEWFDVAADPGETIDMLEQAGRVATDELERARHALDLALAANDTTSVGDGIPQAGYLSTPMAPASVHTLARAENAKRRAPRSRLASIRALTEGVRLLDGRQFAAAVAILDAAAADDAKNPALMFHLARALGKLGVQDGDAAHLDRSIGLLKSVREVRPALLPARDLLLFMLFQRREFDAAKALYAAAVADGSATASTFEAMARIRLDLAKTIPAGSNPLIDENEAFLDFERAIERGATPALVDLLTALELRYSQQGQALQAQRIGTIRAAAAQNVARDETGSSPPLEHPVGRRSLPEPRRP